MWTGIGLAGLGLVVVFANPGCLPRESGDDRLAVVRIDQVQISPLATPEPPPEDDPSWRGAQLPRDWEPFGQPFGGHVWLRASFTTPAPPHRPWTFFLAAGAIHADLFLNGEPIGVHLPASEAARQNDREPVLAEAPPRLLHAGRNDLSARLVVRPDYHGFLSPIWFGPPEALMPAHRWLRSLTVTLPFGVSILAIGVGALVLVASRIAANPAYVWFAACFLVWGVAGLAPAELHWSAWSFGLAAGCALGIVGAHRGMGLSRQRVERALAVLLAAALVLLLAVPLAARTYVVQLLALGSGALSLYALVLFARAVRDGTLDRPLLMAIAVGLSIALGLYELDVIIRRAPLLGTTLYDVIHVPAVVFGAANLTLLLVDALEHSRRLNLELEDRVAAREHELAGNYQRLQELERERAVLRERERITRDMHDGTGGRLVSTLSLVRRGRASPNDIEHALEDALDDLRITVESLRPAAADLPAVLGMLRRRLERQLSQHEMALEWAIGDAGEGLTLEPEAILHVTRIVQEAVTNAVRHSGGRRVRISTTPLDPPAALALEISDDGHGGLAPRPGGRGLANLQQRAEQLNGRLEVESGEGGSLVRLFLPDSARAAR